MTERLRELMEEAGAEAPAVRVRTDTWRRARRTRVVELVVVPVLVVAAVVLGGLSVAGLPGASQGFAPAGSEGAPTLPAVIYDVPEWVDPSDDLAVGQLSVVWSQNGRPGVVGVRAEDGAYVALDLPGFDAGSSMFADFPRDAVLSPDGNQLAYVRGKEEAEGSALRVLDLETGDVRSFLDDPTIVEVDQLAWDGAGDQLSYRAMEFREGEGGLFGPEYWGSIDLATGQPTRWPVPALEQAAIAEDGESLLHVSGRSVYRLSADGSRSLVGRAPASYQSSSEEAVVDSAAGVAVLGSDMLCWFPAHRDFQFVESGDLPPYRTMLAKTGTRVTTVASRDGGGYVIDTRRPGAVGPHALTRHLGSQLHAISVADELTTTPRRDFPEPDWPPNPLVYWVGGLLALTGLLGCLWWTRRRS